MSNTIARTETKLVMRRLCRRDMPRVIAIEDESFEYPWCSAEFFRCSQGHNHVGMVAEQDGKIVGFMIFSMETKRIHVLNFAVASDHRRCGIGTQMVDYLMKKLRGRKRVVLEVRERNLPAQLFYRSIGFIAISVIHDFYTETPEDAYRFVRWKDSVVPSPVIR